MRLISPIAALALLASQARAAPSVSDLQHVNDQYNASIRYERGASWAPNAQVGDCKVYAVTKRAALLALGWSSDTLAVWRVADERGEDHAVLVATLGDTPYVLDNREVSIWSKAQLERHGYRFEYAYEPWLLATLAN